MTEIRIVNTAPNQSTQLSSTKVDGDMVLLSFSFDVLWAWPIENEEEIGSAAKAALIRDIEQLRKQLADGDDE